MIIDDYLTNELINSTTVTADFYSFIIEVRDRENAEISPRRTTMLRLKQGAIFIAHAGGDGDGRGGGRVKQVE